MENKLNYLMILKRYKAQGDYNYKQLSDQLGVSETYARHVVNENKPLTRSFIQRMRENIPAKFFY